MVSIKSFLKKSPKNIGLALGGGAALGAVHIGVLKAIDELDINIEYISGTSIGSLIAALYAFGKSPNQIEKVALKLNWLDVSRVKISKYGILNNSKIKPFIKEQIGNVSFEDSKIPLAVVATDLISRKKVVLKNGLVEDGVLASTCIPGVFSPIQQNDMLLVDGGVVENVPVSTLEELGAKFKISVDLTSYSNTTIPKNIIDVIISSINLAMMSSTINNISKADIQISPNLGRYSPIDSKKTKELIDLGYNTSLPLLRRYF
jgi:NTE family protein